MRSACATNCICVGWPSSVRSTCRFPTKVLTLDCGYRIDLIVQKEVVLELKAIERIMPIHQAQLLTYMKLSGMNVGLLINFNAPLLTQGIIRRVL